MAPEIRGYQPEETKTRLPSGREVKSYVPISEHLRLAEEKKLAAEKTAQSAFRPQTRSEALAGIRQRIEKELLDNIAIEKERIKAELASHNHRDKISLLKIKEIALTRAEKDFADSPHDLGEAVEKKLKAERGAITALEAELNAQQ